MTLPNDIARCAGVGNDEKGWREGWKDRDNLAATLAAAPKLEETK